MDTASLRIPHSAYDAEKLEIVKTEMRRRGVPTIRVVRYPNYYMAIEGCHRLTAAAELGFAPVLVVLAANELVEVASLDSDFFGDEKFVLAGEAADTFHSDLNSILTINSDGTITLPACRIEDP
jgi:hypothetical protein